MDERDTTFCPIRHDSAESDRAALHARFDRYLLTPGTVLNDGPDGRIKYEYENDRNWFDIVVLYQTNFTRVINRGPSTNGFNYDVGGAVSFPLFRAIHLSMHPDWDHVLELPMPVRNTSLREFSNNRFNFWSPGVNVVVYSDARSAAMQCFMQTKTRLISAGIEAVRWLNPLDPFVTDADRFAWESLS